MCKNCSNSDQLCQRVLDHNQESTRESGCEMEASVNDSRTDTESIHRVMI